MSAVLVIGRRWGFLARAAVLAASALAALTPAAVAAGAAAGAAKVRPFRSTEARVRFTSRVIELGHAFARRELSGISTDGTFKFRSATGPIGKLRKGSVLVISAWTRST
jgi:hypothetical protein